MENNDIFFLHTSPEYPGYNWEPRATIACKIVGDDIVYGYAICAAGDNFSRRKGREIATKRMNLNFDNCQFTGAYYEQRFGNNKGKALEWFAKLLSKAIKRNPQKYKNRLGEFEKELQEKALSQLGETSPNQM